MTALTGTPKTTDPICPSWCTGHNDAGYQDWFPFVSGSLIRDHDDTGTTVGGISVHVTQVQSLLEGMEPAEVWVSESNADVETHRMTPDRARELAAAILAAADRIDAEAAR